MRKKAVLYGFLDFFFILGIVLSNTYRPYIYENHIFDFHLADTIGNFGSSAFSLFVIIGYEKI